MLQYNRTVSYSKASRGWFCLLRTLVSRYRVFFSTRKLYDREGSGDCYSLSNLVFLVGIFRNSVTFSEWFFPFLHHCYHRLLAVTFSRQSRIVKSVLFLLSYFFLLAFFLPSNFPYPLHKTDKKEREKETHRRRKGGMDTPPLPPPNHFFSFPSSSNPHPSSSFPRPPDPGLIEFVSLGRKEKRRELTTIKAFLSRNGTRVSQTVYKGNGK